jgi:hypothetical protein
MSEGFPPGIGRVIVKPHVSYISHGLDWSWVYGRLLPQTWAVWDRETRVVQSIYYVEPNVHGWSNADKLAERASRPPNNGSFNPFELDAVP